MAVLARLVSTATTDNTNFYSQQNTRGRHQIHTQESSFTLFVWCDGIYIYKSSSSNLWLCISHDIIL